MRVGERWYHQVLHVVPNTDRIRSFVTDITERKQVEETLVRQNAYLAALHATTLGMMSRHELDDLLETIIARAAELLGTAHGFVFLQVDGAKMRLSKRWASAPSRHGRRGACAGRGRVRDRSGKRAAR